MRTFCGVGAMVLPSWTRRTYRTPQSPRGRPFTGSGDLWRGSSQAGRGVFGFPEALRVCQWIPRARGCGCLDLQAMTPTRRRFIDGCYE